MMNCLVSTVSADMQAGFEVKQVQSPLERDLKDDQVVVRVEASPINPSDLGVILPPGTNAQALSTIKQNPNGVGYQLDKKFTKLLTPRIGKSVPCGNEGAGVVVKAGASKAAQALLGKVVSLSGGKLYAEYRLASTREVLVHNEGTTPEEAASSFVNPLTVVGMVEQMRLEKYKGIIHTAAASNLGQMLLRYCNQQKVPLINVVRKESQEKLLREMGAEFVVRSDKPTFISDLAELVAKTKITLAFDAIGGGKVASNLFTAMEIGAKKFGRFDPNSPYGTDVIKQVYSYGSLDFSPTVLGRGFGFAWRYGGWLLTSFLQQIGRSEIKRLQQVVADNIKTVFKSTYVKKVSLQEAVKLENFNDYTKMATGKKYLVLPNKKPQAKL